MKVFFDGGIFGRQKIGGISRLNFELIKALSKKKDIEQIFYRGFYVDSYPFKNEWFGKYYGIRKPDFLKSRISMRCKHQFLYRLPHVNQILKFSKQNFVHLKAQRGMCT